MRISHRRCRRAGFGGWTTWMKHGIMTRYSFGDYPVRSLSSDRAAGSINLVKLAIPIGSKVERWKNADIDDGCHTMMDVMRVKLARNSLLPNVVLLRKDLLVDDGLRVVSAGGIE